MSKCALILEDLQLRVRLGVTAAERAKKQLIFLQIKIAFSKPPHACKTGKIEDTICYFTLVENIKKFCEGKEFILIEELGMQLFSLIKKSIYKNCSVCLHVVKHPPMRDLARGVFEICG